MASLLDAEKHCDMSQEKNLSAHTSLKTMNWRLWASWRNHLLYMELLVVANTNHNIKKIPVNAPTKISPMSAPYNHVKPCRAAPSMHRRSIALSRSPAVPSWTQPSHTHSISGITVALTKTTTKNGQTHRDLPIPIHKYSQIQVFGAARACVTLKRWFGFPFLEPTQLTESPSSRTPG